MSHLWSEARYARRRINGRLVTEGLLIRAVIGEAFDSEGGGRILRKLLKRLEDYG